MNSVTWRELANLHPLPDMCRLIHRIFGVEMALLAPDGREGFHMIPRTKKAPFCRKIKTLPDLKERCLQCDRLHVDQAWRARIPFRYHCHAGLSEFLIPIVIEGQVVAHLNCGQVLDHKPRPSDRKRLMAKFGPLGLDTTALWNEFRRVRVIPSRTQEDLLRLLTHLAQHVAVTHARLLAMDQPPGRKIVALAQSAMRQRLQEPLRIADIAVAAGTSKRTLERIFRKETGGSASACLRRLRVDHACAQLRETQQPITAIALSSGFGSVQQFNRTFKSATGHTPRAWRQAARTASP